MQEHERDTEGKKFETLKVITVKQVENRFAPLYFKRISYKLSKDAKTFNFSIYFAIINLLMSKKIYYPCITMLSLFIVEISSINIELYEEAKTNQKTEAFLYLYEFLVFNQVQQLIALKNFDRALFELLRIMNPINEFSTLIYKSLLGLCLSHCYYYDAAVFNLCEGANLIQPLMNLYKSEDQNIQSKDKKGQQEAKIKQRNVECNFILFTYL